MIGVAGIGVVHVAPIDQRLKHLGKIGDAELEYYVPTGCYRPYRKAGLS